MRHITPRRAAIVALSLLFALLILMPLRIAFDLSGLQDRGVSARAVEGLVWSGKVRELTIGNLPLGDVDARLEILPLLIARSNLIVDRPADGFTPALHAIISGHGGSLSISDANADIAMRGAFAPVPVSNVVLENVNAEFELGRCVQASGTVRMNLQAGVPGLNLSQGLSGKIACRGGALFVPLVGQSGLEKLDLTIQPDGRYDALFRVDGLTPDIAGPLGTLGFSGNGNSLQLRASGQF